MLPAKKSSEVASKSNLLARKIEHMSVDSTESIVFCQHGFSG